MPLLLPAVDVVVVVAVAVVVVAAAASVVAAQKQEHQRQQQGRLHKNNSNRDSNSGDTTAVVLHDKAVPQGGIPFFHFSRCLNELRQLHALQLSITIGLCTKQSCKTKHVDKLRIKLANGHSIAALVECSCKALVAFDTNIMAFHHYYQ